MIRNLLLFLVLCLYPTFNLAQVSMKDVFIETEFYGALNKTRLEFFIENQGKRDSVTADFGFKINKTAIVTDLYLEIDGALKRAETLSERAGTAIFEQLSQLRIDPAVMIKNDNGMYSIAVFPVNANEVRRCVVEYYSVLEHKDNNFSMWTFEFESSNWNNRDRTQWNNIQTTRTSTRDAHYHLSSSSYWPFNTEANITAGDVKYEFASGERSYTFKSISNDQIEIGVNFNALEKDICLYNDECQLFQHQCLFTRKIIEINNKTDIITVLPKLINDIKNDESIAVSNELASPFLASFLAFLNHKYNVPVNLHRETVHWMNYDNQWMYIDSLIQIDSFAGNKKPAFFLYCPFLSEFPKYVNSFQYSWHIRKKQEYLIIGLSKLVLEDNDDAMKVRQEEIEKFKMLQPMNHEVDYFNAKGSDEHNSIVFYSLDEPPTPKHGWMSLKDHFVYPPELENIKIEGTVSVYCYITSDGKIEQTRVIQSLHPLVDNRMIMAIRLTEWLPATYRDQAMSSWLMVPGIVKWSGNKPPHGRIDKVEYTAEQLQEEVSIVFEDYKAVAITTEFSREKAFKIKYMSDKCFEILFDHPEYIVSVQHILGYMGCNEYGLVIDGEHILFIR
ncbi:energy transducer TonB [bacterium]|nr:energy transducer TonB [bacterium]